MSDLRLLYSFDDPEGRFRDYAEYVESESECVVVGRSGLEALWSWSLPDCEFTEHPIPEPATVEYAAIQSRGRLLALIGSDDHDWDRPTSDDSGSVYRLWDLGTGEKMLGPIRLRYGWDMTAMAIREHGDRLIGLTGTANCFAVTWDLAIGEQIGGKEEEIGESVDTAALAEVDGRLLAVVGSLDDTVRIWEVDTDRELRTPWLLPGFVTAVAVTEYDGRPVVLAAGGFEGVRLWDIRDGKELGHSLPCEDMEGDRMSVLRHGDRTFVLVEQMSVMEHPVRLYDLASGTELATDLTADAAAGLLGRHKGRPIAILTDEAGTGRVWDLSAAGER